MNFDSWTVHRIFLGTLIVFPQHFPKYIGVVKPECFNKTDKFVYELMLEMHSQGIDIDLVTIWEFLHVKYKNRPIEKQAETISYIASLTTPVCSDAHLKSHAWFIQCRQIEQEVLKKINTDVKSPDFADKISEAHYLIEEQKKIRKIELYSAYDAIDMHRQMIIQNIKNGHRKYLGIPTGFSEIDKVTEGLTLNTMTILGGETGHGKTDALMNLLNNFIYLDDPDYDVAICLFNYEMIVELIINRLFCVRSSFTKNQLKKGQLSQDEMIEYDRIASVVGNSRFSISDPTRCDTEKIKTITTIFKNEQSISYKGNKKLVYIFMFDYLQLINSKAEKNQKKNYQVADVTRYLRELSLEPDTIVIALSQYNRNYKSEVGKRLPRTSDLQDSSEIEKAADNVWLLHNPYKFHIETYDDGESTKNTLQIVLDKTREGENAIVRLRYLPHTGEMRKYEFGEPTRDINESSRPDEPNSF